MIDEIQNWENEGGAIARELPHDIRMTWTLRDMRIEPPASRDPFYKYESSNRKFTP